jgi:hypothetical protein
MMEAASISETSVSIYQTTRCNIPEESHVHTPRRENLISLIGGLLAYILSYVISKQPPPETTTKAKISYNGKLQNYCTASVIATA